MSQEKLKVLEMLSEGKITSEEALSLIECLQKDDSAEGQQEVKSEKAADDSAAQSETAQNNAEGSADQAETEGESQEGQQNEGERKWDSGFFPNDFTWVNDLKNNIVESAINISNYVGLKTYNSFSFNKLSHVYSVESQPVGQQIKSLRLNGKNNRVEVTGYDGTSIKIEAIYTLKGTQDPQIELDENEGSYVLNYDANAVYSMGLYVKVPRAKIDDLIVVNKNADVLVKKVLADRADITTKNGVIEIDKVDSKDLSAETKNAPIYVYSTYSGKINLKTSIATISIKDTNADFARLVTSNAAINTDSIDIRELFAKTTNSGLLLKNLQNIASSGHSNYNIEAYTTNGNVAVELPDAGIPCKISASTTAGNIEADVEGMDYLVSSKDFVKAKSKDYDTADRKINFILQTSNGNIEIK